MKWLIALAISQLVDVVTTGFVLYRGGQETNHIALAIIHSGGIQALLLAKIAFVVLAGLIVYRATRYRASYVRFTNFIIGGMAVTFLIGSGWNLFVGLIS